MMRTVISVLFLALSASAYNTAFVNQRSARANSKLSATPNFMGEVKMDFSGPNMMAGHPDDKPDILPSTAASDMVLKKSKEPTMAVSDIIEMEDEDVPLAAPGNKNVKRIGGWVTAVFWSDLNLYGNVYR
eukprot:CAMPEP_0176035862 /NCGR_PEP_ID=MMETSP0120_2-20121206/17752_1 /TAXON_ID=160619 /ORGANISM="Kryptoperidinium foliaceum, Strain CCMP 1326" /LENGTH=129 /DNA_ID=CAMNT_0017369237 /DNA_START=93 /DNA_END=482 /DNA_ORIENTATION=+